MINFYFFAAQSSSITEIFIYKKCQLTSHYPVLPERPVVLGAVLAVGELAEAAGEVAGDGVLQPVVGDVEQLQCGPADHTLGYVVGHQAF